jgi:hypothetical protein
MKKTCYFLLIFSTFQLYSSLGPRTNSRDSVTTQPYSEEERPLLHSRSHASTMPRHGTALNDTVLHDYDENSVLIPVETPLDPATGQLLSRPEESVGVRVPYILTAEELARQNRINHEVQVAPFFNTLKPLCFFFAVAWTVGAGMMSIEYAARKH